MAGGDDVVPVSPRAQRPSGGGRQGHRQKAAWLPLPLDIIVAEIAARSDAATLVRCAATCRDARRRVAEDPSLGGRLRLRDTGRFLLPLLRGHMTRITTYTRGGPVVMTDDVYLVDAAAAAASDSTRLVKANFAAAGADAETLSNFVPLDSRRGLFLVHATTTTTTTQNQRQLFVWNPATRRRLVLPPEPAFPGEDPDAGRSTQVQYVLLVGDSDGKGAGAGAGAAVDRPFQVAKVKLVLSRSHCRLLVQTFSSEHGAWSPCTEIPTSIIRGSDRSPSPLQRRPLVVGDDVVHWLCLTDRGSYLLTLHARAAAPARVSVTALPASFPRDEKTTRPYMHPYDGSHYHYLLATATAAAGGNPVVLVADADRISAWEQSKHGNQWKPRPRVVMENETILRRFMRDKCVPRLELFGEKSGALLLRIPGCCLLWLDLRTKKILRCFSSERLLYGQVCCAYEMDLASWVPTFSSDVISVE